MNSIRGKAGVLCQSFLIFITLTLIHFVLPSTGEGSEVITPQLQEGTASKSTIPTFCDESKVVVQFSDETKSEVEEPQEFTCQARNVWKSVCQTPQDPYVKGTKKLKPGCSAQVPFRRKRAVDREAYEQWKSLDSPVLSEDGQWVAYTVTSTDSELVVRDTTEPAEFRVLHATGTPQITRNSRFVLFSVAPTAEHGKSGKSALEGSSRRLGRLGIMSLPEGLVTTVAQVESYVLPKNGRPYVAYFLRPDESLPGSPRTLVVRDLHTGAQIKLSDVDEFLFDDKGEYFAYAVSSHQQEKNGVYMRHLSDGRTNTLLSGEGRYKMLVFDRDGRQFAFFTDRDERKQVNPRYSLYHVKLSNMRVKTLVKTTDLSEGFQIGSEVRAEFNRSGSALTFDIVRNEDRPARGRLPSRRPEVWRWNDASTPVQKQTGWRPTRPGAYLAVYQFTTDRWIQLGSESVPFVHLTDDARYAVGVNQGPYKVRETWGEVLADIYVIDALSGASRLLHRGHRSQSAGGRSFPIQLWFSPGGRYMLYFDDRRWFSFQFDSGELTDLTGALLPEVPFDRGVGDVVDPAPPIGIAGWETGDKRVLIYDRQDVWRIDPSGKTAPYNLTSTINRNKQLIFRVWPHNHFDGLSRFRPDGDRNFISDVEPLTLTAFDKETIATGIWRVHPAAKIPPEPMLMADKRIKLISRATRGGRYLVTQETFTAPPDLWTGMRLDRLRRLSDVNPLQTQYRWGVAELVGFKSNLGISLKGVLYKPEGFDATKKYPMIVDIYLEQHDQLHAYKKPMPSTGATLKSPTRYLSKGYIVFQPDILTTAPYPLQSAIDAVVPAVQSVVDRGFVDASRVGLTGHSYGGWQVNFIITQTNVFRCAITGAGISNLISYYGGSAHRNAAPSSIERSYGMQRAPLWDQPYRYLINSPLMFADRVRTPVLLMYTHEDVIVPIEQGMEWFNALRRNQVQAYMVEYFNENHVLGRYSNIVDWDARMHEFFDHYLKGSPMPEWMRPE